MSNEAVPNERQLLSEGKKKSWDVSDPLNDRLEVVLEASVIWVTEK